jgi:phenylalanyl-tRNA synthetase beta chain
MITEMLVNMGITGVTFVKQTENKTFHPGRCADVYIPRTVGEGEDPIYIGTMGEIYPDIADAYGIGTRVYATELFFALIGEQARTDIHYAPLPKYPSTERDIALVVDEKVTVGEVEELILANGGEILESVKLFDIFRGVQVGPGKKSLAFNLVYRSKEGTLTDEEVAPVHNKVVEVLEKTLNANLRAM